MNVSIAIALAGLSGLAGLIVYVGYLFYDKDPRISAILLIIGVTIAICLVASQIILKQKELEYRARGWVSFFPSRNHRF